ncbi:hypothetical protein CLV59_101370 [Chitinophaga dinghuensis]|uniref:Uncharacterized protein n=1 Tax=Chitinophaga dinghuensis TaxID=1539050 RepID=A0A327WBQ9_9BACT|nr:hypothetical protein [Chitinophaga dinghuensis]RAJ87609.1 hypothetical protein CLV59_101370 [Chitinophaga dinghuensis]
MNYADIQKSVLEELDFLNFRKELGNKYGLQADYWKAPIDVEVVKSMLKEMGYTAKYTKTENFFSIKEKYGDIEFTFQTTLKGGCVEIGWYTLFEGKKVNYSGAWTRIAMEFLGEHIPLPIPMFKNYEELKEILSVILNKYGVYKAKFMAAAAKMNQ